MQYSIARNGQAVTVALQGQLNFAANDIFAGLLRDLDGVEAKQVVFDLSGLSHIDSVGLGLLYIAREDLDGVGAVMSLAKPQGGVKRLLELTEAGETFRITD
ncbi:STAS domain-containing protein [Paramagnetospirillum magneticum]|uniref:Anti-anti-sigma regulatory factor n=1 Tax=Paramagnetospirillum magneticum (strain ATCC 700264 / AMB-1) TaxID=342108 RepID=Q2W1W8_PARM1|nr:STAS domain-containing protein [Paramagnetospirillum magneticum]BAE52157.1 Anti-anti-sigma regulatory factor [Paramagnetospirillum magneticum AMB-1]